MVGFVHKLGWCGSGALVLDASFTHSLVIGVVGLVTVGLQLVNNLLIRKKNKNENL